MQRAGVSNLVDLVLCNLIPLYSLKRPYVSSLTLVSLNCRFNIDLCSNCEALSQYVDDAGMSIGSPSRLSFLCCSIYVSA